MAQRKTMSSRAGSDGQKLDFSRPDRASNANPGRQRFIPTFTVEEASTADEGVSDFFSDADFKARWWPAPE